MPTTVMTAADVLAQFDTVRSEQTATILGRRNPAARILGVKFGDIDKLAKKIKRDTALAIELWESGAVEARELACRIVEPTALSEAQIDRMVEQIDFPTLADSFAGVVYRTPFAHAKRDAWTQRTDEFVRRAGFHLVYQFAADSASDLSDAEAHAFLGQIELEIHDSTNWAREMMNLVPIAIGQRNEGLLAPAMATAQAYGKVAVFHGDNTRCTVKNAVDVLQSQKVLAKPPA